MKEIKVTNEYEKFKKLKGNRAVTEKRKEKIKKSILKVGYITSPILVNDEFEIIDVNIGKNQTIAESFTIKLKNDKICNATLAFTDEKCKEILENKEKYIGKMATVCYFGVTNDGLLRFPVVKAIDRQSYE